MNDSIPSSRRQWADHPFPLIETPKHKAGKTGYTDAYTETASTMCVVHNTLLRGLNSIYLQGPHVPPSEYKDFIGYSLCWYAVVHEHHTSEEETFFPDIEKSAREEGLMDGNVEQHKSFLPGLLAYESYLTSLSSKESSFNAAHLNSIIDSFAPALCAHLASEIDDLLALRRFGDTLPIEALWNKEGRRTVFGMTTFSALPFFFRNLDLSSEEGLYKHWPPLPGAASWVIKNVFTLWHPGFWKFASCDGKGQRTEKGLLYA